MTTFACLLVFLLLRGALSQVQQDDSVQDEQHVSTIRIAAELARLASTLTRSSHRNQALGARRRRPRDPSAACACPHTAAAAVQNVNNTVTRSVPVAFKGHNLTVVALVNDEAVGATILSSKQPFQSELLGPLLDYVRPGSTVIDAGAHMGDFTVFFAAATGPSGLVYAFEPQARMYQLLCTNMIINGLLQIQPMRNALSYEPGVLQLSGTVTDGSSGGKAYKDADREKRNINYGGMRLGVGGENVTAITLDSLNLTDVSLLKVDIQGAEKPMFYGAQETIKRSLPVIAYEAGENSMAAAVDKDLHLPQHVRDFNIEELLKSLGYAVGSAANGDNIMLPPGKANGAGTGRRSVLALPPRRR